MSIYDVITSVTEVKIEKSTYTVAITGDAYSANYNISGIDIADASDICRHHVFDKVISGTGKVKLELDETKNIIVIEDERGEKKILNY